MATQSDVRRIALALPGTNQAKTGFAFSVRYKNKEKGFAWVWQERVHPRKARVPNPEVLAVRVADLDERDVLLAADGDKFFTEPHYLGYPAVLVRLRAVGLRELKALLTNAWRCLAPGDATSAPPRPRRAPAARRAGRGKGS